MSEQKPIKHHFIPKGYIKKFVDESKKVSVANIGSRSIRRSSPKGVGWLPYFYQIDTTNEKESSEAEEALSRVESIALPLLVKVAESKAISHKDMQNIAMYLALQYGRTPTMKKKMDDYASKIAPRLMREEADRIVSNPSEYRKMLVELSSELGIEERKVERAVEDLRNNPDIEMELTSTTTTYVSSFFRISKEISEALVGYKWIVYMAPKGSSFITSDNPLVLHLTRKLKEGEQLAILLPGTVRFFPLSSQACLIITNQPTVSYVEYRVISKGRVRAINKLILSQAGEHLIAKSELLLRSLIGYPK